MIMYTIFKAGHARGFRQSPNLWQALQWAQESGGVGWLIEDSTGFGVARDPLR